MRAVIVAAAILALAGCGPAAEDADEATTGDVLTVVEDIEARLAQFAPTELAVDIDFLAEAERQAVGSLVEAAKLMDEIFLRQVSTDNPALRARLATADLPVAAREYFAVNFGPWDRLAEFEPFLGTTPHPPGAGYYPVDMSREELETWLAAHPADREALTGLFTVVRRDGEGLAAVPYSAEYAEWLDPAAEHLRRAAAATGNESLRKFLELRADAFGSDDYYESDMAWMDLDSPVEVTIGPYETYEDGLFGYKAAFEAFVTVASPQESAALERFKSLLPSLEAGLPIPDEHKNPDRGTESPIRVVDVVYSAGDGRAGVQPIAFNLPNDERVREAKGSKKVLLRNLMRAKYDQILVPIAARVLTGEDRARVSFDAYFNEVLHHELSHGLGPGRITVDGRDTEVRLELKEHYSTLEEAKADVMGIFNILALIESGEMPAELRDTLEATYVAGLFRSARFGVHEAHGQGVVSQFNYLLEKGALEVDDNGMFRCVSDLFAGAIEDLLGEMLMLQASGDYDGTAAFLEAYGRPSEALVAAIGRLSEVPVDIRPVFSYPGS